MKKKFNVKIVVISSFVVVVMLYLVGVAVFWNKFGFRTYVNGELVTLSTSDDVVLDVVNAKNSNTVVLLRRGGSKEIVPFSRLGIYYVVDDKLSVSESPFLWFTSFFHDTNYTLSTSLDYDYDTLVNGVSNLDCVSSDYVLPASDSYVSLQEDGTCTVVTEFSGTEIDIDKLTNVICESVQAGEFNINLEENGCYVNDLIRKQNLDYEVKTDVISSMSLKLNDSTIIDVPEDVINSIIYSLDDKQYIRYSLVYAYVQALAEKYDTVGTTRQFTTSSGDVITLNPSKSDNYLGWDMDIVDTAMDICSFLAEGSSSIVDAIWSSKGVIFDDSTDIGDTYIEISIDKQHMWVYHNGALLLDADVTTGKDVDGMRTPKGLYHTLDWNTEYTMHGSYGTAFSHYFIRVTSAGVGIHDSSWRSTYGSDYYKTDGSHGCINTPFDKVDLLYKSLVSESKSIIPVIIY